MLETRNFLMPDATFAIEMLTFLVVLFVMMRYVLPRVRGAMQARQRAVEESLAAAADAEVRRRQADDAAADILAGARRRAREITESGWAMREHLVAEGRASGLAEHRRLTAREEQRRVEVATRLVEDSLDRADVGGPLVVAGQPEPVAAAKNGEDQGRLPRVRLDLAAQVLDV